jgi:hypothetical protein
MEQYETLECPPLMHVANVCFREVSQRLVNVFEAKFEQG